MPFKLLFLTLFPYTTLFRSPRALRRTPGHGGRAAPRRTRRRRRCSTRRIRTVRSGHRRDRQAQATAIGVVEHTSTREGRAMRARWGAPLLAGTALLVGLTAAGRTFAIWTAGTGPDAVTISAGDLDIEPAGAAVWQETSADVSGTPRTIDPETFLVRQGDTVDVTYQVTTHLQGENMLGQLEVVWTDPADLPTGEIGRAHV